MFDCHGETHVYLVGQPYCTCGGQIAVWGTCPICPQGVRSAYDQPESEHIVYPNGDTQCPQGVRGAYPQGMRSAYPPMAATSSAMGWFGTGYAPPGYKPAKPKVDEDVPLSRLKAAVDAKASHLSADGLRGYRNDRGNPEVCFWDAELGRFDSWWACGQVANDAVKLDSEEQR